MEYADKPYLGHRTYNKSDNSFGDYVWETYKEVGVRIDNFASGLGHIYAQYVKPGCSSSENAKWPVGIYAVNRPEWRITEYAGYYRNLYNVALYDTLGSSAVEYIVNHAEVPIIVCSLDKVPRLLKLTSASRLPHLKCIVSMDSFDNSTADGGIAASILPSPFNMNSVRVLREWSDSVGIKLFGFSDLEAMGAKNRLPHIPPTPDDICTICYTSGTTGTPKGAMSTHRNYTTVGRTATTPFQENDDDCMISYLPLAHCYQRTCEISLALRGGRIGYYCGDILRIVDDIQVLRPSIFIGVPRLLNRIYDKLVSATLLAPGLGGVIARKAITDKMANLEQGKGVTHAFWDRVVFRKIKAILGGRIEIIISGSAPLEPKIMQFLRIAFCCTVIEGFGQTETSACSSFTPIDMIKTGCIGIPFPGVEFKLIDIPEMGYLSTDKPDPRGEICIRGDITFKGYYKDPESTKKTLTDDGWVLTGDVGRINSDGTFSIIDRKKNIFKLSHGEYIAPEKLENIYSSNPYVQQIAVHGDSFQSSLVAIVVPDPETFIPWAAKIIGGDDILQQEHSLESLCRNPTIQKELIRELAITAKASLLSKFEYIKAIHLEHRPFDVETNELLTPTMKLKRANAIKYYKKELASLYDQIARK